jgi:ABC-type cobalt transport system substrate-binding protein
MLANESMSYQVMAGADTKGSEVVYHVSTQYKAKFTSFTPVKGTLPATLLQGARHSFKA